MHFKKRAKLRINRKSAWGRKSTAESHAILTTDTGLLSRL
jgi:hypothetical protein